MQIVKKVVAPAFFVVVSAVIAFFFIFNSLYVTAYAVYIDGEEYGVINDPEDVEQIVDTIENEVSAIREEDYTLDCDIEYEEVTVLSTHVTDTDDIEEKLYDSIDGITQGFTLKVDGETVGIAELDDINGMIDSVIDKYVTDETVDVKVLSDVEIDYEVVPSETENNLDNMVSTLLAVNKDPVIYIAQEGDTIQQIIDDNDITETELFALNPNLKVAVDEETERELEEEQENSLTLKVTEIENTEDAILNETKTDEDTSSDENAAEDGVSDKSANEATTEETAEETEETSEKEEGEESQTSLDIPIEEGTEIILDSGTLNFVVETEEYVNHEEETPYGYELIEDEDMYIGESEVRVEGENGTDRQYETVTYRNGVETDRVSEKRETLTEPTNEVTAIGTKEPEKEVVIDTSDEDTFDYDGYDYIYDDDGNKVLIVESPNATVRKGYNYYSSGFMWPLQNVGPASTSSSYGWRWIDGGNEFHKGIDISASAGTEILASKAGTVIINQYNSARGWYVQIDHGDGYQTIYQHMCQQSSLQVGETVVQGQVVGYVGTTGYSFGNHLHFEVWQYNGSSYDAIDPMTVLTDVVSSETMQFRSQVVAYAESYLGHPYVHGGHGPDMYQTSDLIAYVNSTYGVSVPSSITTPNGVRSYMQINYNITIPYVFDCSGFTEYIYKYFGYEIYYTVEGQLNYGHSVSVDELEPGDLIFFSTDGSGNATHVGMYIGNNEYIHASSTYGQVVTDTVRSTANRPIVACRRIVD